MFRQERRFQFPPIGAGTDKSTFYFYKVRTMQRRHLRREYVSFRHIGNQNPTKAGIPLCHYRHIFSPTVSPCLEKASTHLFPTLSPPLSPLLQFGFNFQLVSCPVSNIVSCLSPPPRSFAVWRLDIKYLLFVLLSSAVGIVYIVYHNFNNYICEQTELAGKLLLPLRQGQPDGSALNGLPKPFTLPSFVHTF